MPELKPEEGKGFQNVRMPTEYVVDLNQKKIDLQRDGDRYFQHELVGIAVRFWLDAGGPLKERLQDLLGYARFLDYADAAERERVKAVVAGVVSRVEGQLRATEPKVIQ